MINTTGHYLGSKVDEIEQPGIIEKTLGGAKSMFRRRGTIELTPEYLVLGNWGDNGDLRIAKAEIESVRREFTPTYSRFQGGLTNKGKPLILELKGIGEIYLFVNYRELTENTDNEMWEKAIGTWLED